LLKLLALLVDRAGRLVAKREILSRVWGDVNVTEAVVKVSIQALRRALGDSARSSRFIRTEARLGYRFIAPIEVIHEPSSGEDLQLLTLSALVGLAPSSAGNRGLQSRYLLDEARRCSQIRDFEHCADTLVAALATARFLSPNDHLLLYEIHVELGHAESARGRFPAARAALLHAVQAARELDDWDRFAIAVIQLGGLCIGSGSEDREVTALLQEALAHLHAPRSVLKACALAVLALVRLPALRRTRGKIELPELPAAKLPAECEGLILMSQLLADWRPDNFDLRKRKAARCLDRLVGTKLEAGARFLEVNRALEAGEAASFTQALEAYRKHVREAKQERRQWPERTLAVLCASLRGDFETAERLIYESLSAGQSLDWANVPLVAHVQLLWLRMLQGRFAEISGVLEERVQRDPSDPGFQAALARVRVELGERVAAHATLRQLTADGLARLPRRYLWLTTMTQLADVCVHVRDHAIARDLYSRLIAYENHCALSYGVAFLGSMHRPLGGLAALLGRREAARRHFELALSIHRRFAAEPLIALTARKRDRLLGSRGPTHQTPRRECW